MSQEFIAARDKLLASRDKYTEVVANFRWPTVDRFNWALDYFDPMARGNDALALHIVEDDGSETKRTFSEMSLRSSQVSNYLRSLGVKRGDAILLMLGNELALWELMLAAMKLGAVVIPATLMLTAEDLQDRLDRGQVRFVVVAASQAHKFDTLAGDYARISVGGAVSGWENFESSREATTEFEPDGITYATDPLFLYFTSGTTSKPKLVAHSHQSYPIGHLSTMFWIGLRPGDVHLNISSPGWAKHAWSCFFAPWIAQATIFISNYARFSAKELLNTLEKHRITVSARPSHP